ncbi:iron compound ABC transporter, permease protein [Proteus penneri ATCC 35198]|nr:iron compound ABC transporter, permease protein [Proteus penneri ATCC 35198]
MISLFIGAGDITPASLFTDPDMRDIFFISRVPRTLSLLLAGGAISVAGLIMQLLTQKPLCRTFSCRNNAICKSWIISRHAALSSGRHLHQNDGRNCFCPSWYIVVYVVAAKDHLKNNTDSAFGRHYA